jgi:hypothetical protein
LSQGKSPKGAILPSPIEIVVMALKKGACPSHCNGYPCPPKAYWDPTIENKAISNKAPLQISQGGGSPTLQDE